jgi:hypothetical protein
MQLCMFFERDLDCFARVNQFSKGAAIKGGVLSAI